LILAIDPGNVESAHVVTDDNLKPDCFGKLNNHDLLAFINHDAFRLCDHVAIEMIASYGMAVGKEVFETCVWIGRFYEALQSKGMQPILIYRKDVKINICGVTKAKDSNIRQALLDRFGTVGTKKAPGWFYGFKADIWSAYAVAVTWHDKQLHNSQNSHQNDAG
jgi:hypothetical protein